MIGTLRVLQVIPRLDSGGAERSTVEIVQALAAAGHRALVATAGGRLCPDVAAAGGMVVTLPLASKSPVQMIANGLALARLMRREQVNIVHARSRAPAWSARLAARLTGAAFVTTYHGLYRSGGAFKRWYNGVMAKGVRVIANSAFTAQHVAIRYPGARVVTIPRGVDLALFDPGAIDPGRVSALRTGWGIDPGAPLLLVPGRLTPWKGQAIVIEALARLAHKEAVAVLIGDTQSDRYRTALQDRARALGLGERVKLVGHCSDMPAAYAAADVVVQASTEPEAFGRVAAEAQAMGAIVVASDLGAAPETVLTGAAATGFLVKPGDPGALAATLDAAIALSPDAREAMAARAKAHVRANFSLTRMCADTLATYAAALEAAHGR